MNAISSTSSNYWLPSLSLEKSMKIALALAIIGSIGLLLYRYLLKQPQAPIAPPDKMGGIICGSFPFDRAKFPQELMVVRLSRLRENLFETVDVAGSSFGIFAPDLPRGVEVNLEILNARYEQQHATKFITDSTDRIYRLTPKEYTTYAMHPLPAQFGAHPPREIDQRLNFKFINWVAITPLNEENTDHYRIQNQSKQRLLYLRLVFQTDNTDGIERAVTVITLPGETKTYTLFALNQLSKATYAEDEKKPQRLLSVQPHIYALN